MVEAARVNLQRSLAERRYAQVQAMPSPSDEFCSALSTPILQLIDQQALTRIPFDTQTITSDSTTVTGFSGTLPASMRNIVVGHILAGQPVPPAWERQIERDVQRQTDIPTRTANLSIHMITEVNPTLLIRASEVVSATHTIRALSQLLQTTLTLSDSSRLRVQEGVFHLHVIINNGVGGCNDIDVSLPIPFPPEKALQAYIEQGLMQTLAVQQEVNSPFLHKAIAYQRLHKIIEDEQEEGKVSVLVVHAPRTDKKEEVHLLTTIQGAFVVVNETGPTLYESTREEIQVEEGEL